MYQREQVEPREGEVLGADLDRDRGSCRGSAGIAGIRKKNTIMTPCMVKSRLYMSGCTRSPFGVISSRRMSSGEDAPEHEEGAHPEQVEQADALVVEGEEPGLQPVLRGQEVGLVGRGRRGIHRAASAANWFEAVRSAGRLLDVARSARGRRPRRAGPGRSASRAGSPPPPWRSGQDRFAQVVLVGGDVAAVGETHRGAEEPASTGPWPVGSPSCGRSCRRAG